MVRAVGIEPTLLLGTAFHSAARLLAPPRPHTCRGSMEANRPGCCSLRAPAFLNLTVAKQTLGKLPSYSAGHADQHTSLPQAPPAFAFAPDKPGTARNQARGSYGCSFGWRARMRFTRFTHALDHRRCVARRGLPGVLPLRGGARIRRHHFLLRPFILGG